MELELLFEAVVIFSVFGKVKFIFFKDGELFKLCLAEVPVTYEQTLVILFIKMEL